MHLRRELLDSSPWSVWQGHSREWLQCGALSLSFMLVQKLQVLRRYVFKVRFLEMTVKIFGYGLHCLQSFYFGFVSQLLDILRGERSPEICSIAGIRLQMRMDIYPCRKNVLMSWCKRLNACKPRWNRTMQCFLIELKLQAVQIPWPTSMRQAYTTAWLNMGDFVEMDVGSGKPNGFTPHVGESKFDQCKNLGISGVYEACAPALHTPRYFRRNWWWPFWRSWEWNHGSWWNHGKPCWNKFSNKHCGTPQVRTFAMFGTWWHLGCQFGAKHNSWFPGWDSSRKCKRDAWTMHRKSSCNVWWSVPKGSGSKPTGNSTPLSSSGKHLQKRISQNFLSLPWKLCPFTGTKAGRKHKWTQRNPKLSWRLQYWNEERETFSFLHLPFKQAAVMWNSCDCRGIDTGWHAQIEKKRVQISSVGTLKFYVHI